MSWKLGFVVLSARWDRGDVALLDALGLIRRGAPRRVHIGDAQPEPFATSIATVGDTTLVLDHLLPYDVAYDPPFASALSDRLRALSAVAPVLAGFLDGVTATYAFCTFDHGVVTRAWEVVSHARSIDHGTPFLEESGRDDEGRVFAVTARWLGRSLADLMFEPGLDVALYPADGDQAAPTTSSRR
ncbi:MAG: hypothetical protein KF773_41970 [Deltaproteobacteria bacterium]|nr:hypothetical protein [Deltaproteobacteria bacterium]MCW5807165.1 hypothetical protein [Deltaproteobacteria bacterium]